MKMLFLMLLLLWNDKEGAHAQGKQTYWVNIPSFLIAVVDCITDVMGEEESLYEKN